MEHTTITLNEIKTVDTWSIKDDSPRGVKTVSADDVKIGDMVVLNNEFVQVVEETAQEKAERENWEHCKRIAEELDDIADGRVYRCPVCGEYIKMDEDTPHTCPNCNEDIDPEDLEAVTMWDYFNDVFDIEYRVGSDKEYRSVSVMVACGGPNIYIDTGERAVLLYWWTDRASYSLLSSTAEAIDEVFEEL